MALLFATKVYLIRISHFRWEIPFKSWLWLILQSLKINWLPSSQSVRFCWKTKIDRHSQEEREDEGCDLDFSFWCDLIKISFILRLESLQIEIFLPTELSIKITNPGNVMISWIVLWSQTFLFFSFYSLLFATFFCFI